MQAHRIIAALWLVCVGACAGPEDRERAPDREACRRHRDHLIDLRLEGTADSAAHHAALVASLGDEFLDACVRLMDVAELDCAARAATLAAARACSKAH